MYDENLTNPMRKELTDLGVQELTTPEAVDQAFGENGTALLLINSVCGCAAGAARPAVALAMGHEKKPDKMLTVFAGVDKEATEKVRAYAPEFPPSSPSMIFLKDGKPVEMIHRHQIEGRSAEEISADIKNIFEQHC